MVVVFAALLAFSLFLLQRVIYQYWWNRGILVVLNFEKELVREGEKVRLLEIVENRKRLPLPSLKVKFQCSRHLIFQGQDNGSVTDKYYRNDLFTLMPYKRITRSHQILCSKRGYYGIYAIDLVGADLFFSEEMMDSLTSNTVLYVIPKLLSASQISPALRRISGEVAARRYELEDPFTYRGIREYEIYDELKMINWKATAKTGELKVNIREHTAVSNVQIFMNLEDKGILRREELLEMSISICAQLAESMLMQGVRVSIFANAGDCITGQHLLLEEITDISGMEGVLKALARLDLDSPMEKFANCFWEKLFTSKESLYTIFISPDRHSEYQSVLMEYKMKWGEDFVWICPVKKQEEEKVEENLKANTIFISEGFT